LITVTAGIIQKNGLILAARKRTGLPLAGYWEFPGGKQEEGETPENCLQRELMEEFSIQCRIGPFLGESVHDDGKKVVRLLGYHVKHASGSFKLTDHDKIRWLSAEELFTVNWAPADIPLVKKIKNIAINEQNQLFYQHNADAYIKKTQQLDMGETRKAFIDLLPAKAHILDLGCGSGRDSRAFLDRSFTVTASDACPAIAELTSKFLGQKVLLQTAQEICDKEKYDAIWACASLLHIPKQEILDTSIAITSALKPGGIWYMSFKLGNGERWNADGRFFNNYTIETLKKLLSSIPQIKILSLYEKEATTYDSTQCWLNALVKKEG